MNLVDPGLKHQVENFELFDHEKSASEARGHEGEDEHARRTDKRRFQHRRDEGSTNSDTVHPVEGASAEPFSVDGPDPEQEVGLKHRV